MTEFTWKECTNCKGKKCPKCANTGWVPVRRSLDVSLARLLQLKEKFALTNCICEGRGCIKCR